ncbi:hypothetical protein MKW98_006290 [Papaver atlanticum]|uniref:N-acetyltransferase domain-containing protein n=1 Tax=Papaver atlanticum TaxID=357466 RepID=A0AAD4TH48_9MAGN|nr:hypothetical protein MKW98_006290 [Papaver atlanticum]
MNSLLVLFICFREVNPKFLHFLQHSAILFALRRNNEEFSSDNEEEPIIREHEEHRGALISSDNGEYVVKEAKYDEEFWASAWLKEEGLYEDRSHDRYDGSYRKQCAEQKFYVIIRQCTTRYLEPFMCIIILRMEGGNVLNPMLKNIIEIPYFRVKYLLERKTYPEELNPLISQELVKPVNLFSTFKKRGSQKYGIIFNVIVAKSARQEGIKQVLLHTCQDNKPALALQEKMGFTILAEATPYLEEHNLYLCSINL